MTGTGVWSGRGLLTLLLLGAFAVSLIAVPWSGDLWHPGGGNALAQFFGAIFALDLSPTFLGLALRSAWQTIAYAATGMTLALAIGALLGTIGSGALYRSPVARWVSGLGARTALGSFRAIHELVWAWLFVAAMGLSPLAGVLALGIPYGGILGRIYADVLNDVPEAPVRALAATGASPRQTFWYGRLPQALPDLVSYTLYRAECAIRSAAVFSFIGLGGLGQQIQLSLDELNYGQVWTLLLLLILIVAGLDLWSSEIRRRMLA